MCLVGHSYGGFGGVREVVVGGIHAGQSHGINRISGDAGTHCECDVKTPDDHTDYQVRSSGQGGPGIGRS